MGWPATPDVKRLFRECSALHDPRTTGNLVAFKIGLGTSARGWTEREIAHLLFLRSEIALGRLRP